MNSKNRPQNVCLRHLRYHFARPKMPYSETTARIRPHDSPTPAFTIFG